jgi:hypothetical protein
MYVLMSILMCAMDIYSMNLDVNVCSDIKVVSMNLNVNVCNDIKVGSKNSLLKNASLSRLMYFYINIFQ